MDDFEFEMVKEEVAADLFKIANKSPLHAVAFIDILGLEEYRMIVNYGRAVRRIEFITNCDADAK